MFIHVDEAGLTHQKYKQRRDQGRVLILSDHPGSFLERGEHHSHLSNI